MEKKQFSNHNIFSYQNIKPKADANLPKKEYASKLFGEGKLWGRSGSS